MDRRDTMMLLAGLAYAALAPMSRCNAQGSDVSLKAQTWAQWNDKDQPVRGGTLRTAIAQDPGVFNPNHWPVRDDAALVLCLEKFVLTAGDYAPSVPWLAESIVQESANGVLMTLREGIAFHDGSPLDAQAVKSQIDWILRPDSGAWTQGWLSGVASVEAAAPLQLRWLFKAPWPAFNALLAQAPGYALSAQALAQDAAKLDRRAVGTGPYLIDEASPGQFIRLKRNPNYWLGKALERPEMPYFDAVHIAVIADPAVRLARFHAGHLDQLTLEKHQYRVLKNDPRIAVHLQAVPSTMALRFNSAQGACADVRVRRAIGHAIDRKALVAGTQHGVGQAASGLFPEDHWARNPALQGVPYNPKLARQLLADAGHGGGLALKGHMQDSLSNRNLAEALKAMLARVSVSWNVELLSPAAAGAKLKDAAFDLAEGGWAHIGDPDQALSALYHPEGAFAAGRAANPALADMIVAARNEASPERRQTLYRDIERLIADAHLDAWLWWEASAVAYQKYVRGYDAAGVARHKEAWLHSHPLWFTEGKPAAI